MFIDPTPFGPKEIDKTNQLGTTGGYIYIAATIIAIVAYQQSTLIGDAY